MNQAHLHLIVNHFPIILLIAGFLTLLVGLLRGSRSTAIVAYCLFIGGALFAFAAMRSGEGAEHIVEKIQGIEKNYIGAHEDWAKKFAIVSFVLGALGLAGIWLNYHKLKMRTIVGIITLIVAAGGGYLAKETGTTGGEIRHTEIRKGTAPVGEKGDGEKEDKD